MPSGGDREDSKEMIVFRIQDKEYRSATALGVVLALESDAEGYADHGRPIRHFLNWSLDRLGDQIPPRDLDLSERVDDETLALTYLFLCDEFGIGEVISAPISTVAGRAVSTRR
jgi:hypothetical protein